MDRLIRELEVVLQVRAGRYSPDQKLSDESIAKLEGLVIALQERGLKVVLRAVSCSYERSMGRPRGHYRERAGMP
jgi:hypothetical protein